MEMAQAVSGLLSCHAYLVRILCHAHQVCYRATPTLTLRTEALSGSLSYHAYIWCSELLQWGGGRYRVVPTHADTLNGLR
jgi:hypothetical protein